MRHSKGSPKLKFIAMSSYIKRTERAQIKNLMLHLKLLEKQEQSKPKTNKRRDTIKVRAKNNEIHAHTHTHTKAI
jgi:hypothetical protein